MARAMQAEAERFSLRDLLRRASNKDSNMFRGLRFWKRDGAPREQAAATPAQQARAEEGQGKTRDIVAAVKLVVGLGNPGRKYDDTRHNVGFQVIDELGRRVGADRPKKKFQGELTETRLAGDRVLLLAPHTFMNRSGSSVLAARDFYKVETEHILIICDDFQLPLGQLRARRKGSSGGQKGLNDVIRRLSDEVPRLRIGIGSPPEGWDVADYVLSKFGKADQETVRAAVGRAADAVETWVADGMDACMNRFNRAPNQDAE